MLYLSTFDEAYIRRTPITGISIPNEIDYLKSQYDFNKSRIVKYYLDKNFSVKNTHLLSGLLDQFPISKDLSAQAIAAMIEDRMEYIAKRYSITSSVDKGIVHNGVFYGGCPESIMVESYDYHYDTIKQNWKTYPCLRTVTHCKNDRKLLLPFGINDGSKTGASSVSINMVALGIKYVEFLKDLGDKENKLSKNMFIAKYVIPGIVESDIDHRFMNMVMDRFYGLNDNVQPSFSFPFAVNTPNNYIDRYLDTTLDIITSRSMEFVNLLRNIHLIFTNNAAELLSFKHQILSSQTSWALISSRIRHMCFLYDVCADKNINKSTISDWKGIVRRLNSSSDLGILEKDRTFKEQLYKIMNM